MLTFDVDRQEPAATGVAGQVTGGIELVCSRCLESFTLPVASDFDLRYVPRAGSAGGEEQEVGEDDLTTAFYEEDQIDLGQLDSRAVPPGAADEAAVLGGLQGALPALRPESEYGHMPVQ